MQNLVKKDPQLTKKILLGMLLGCLVGLVLHHGEDLPLRNFLVTSLFDGMGKIFVASLKMLVVPIVFVSLVCGVCGLEDINKLGRMGFQSLFLYLGTTVCAITLALGVAHIFDPGVGFDLPTDVTFQPKAAPSVKDVIIGIVPSNPFAAAAKGNMLQIIVFALFFGTALAHQKQTSVINFFHELNSVFMKMVTLLMKIAPLGVFALLAELFADQGLEAISPLLAYFFTVALILFLQAVMIYGGLLKVIIGMSPIAFFKQFKSVLLFAFSTASSTATLPITMQTITEKFKVKPSISSFTLPLGATINMDGTAIMQGVATVFIAQAYNVPMELSSYLLVVLTATLASIGAAGVPGVGLITLAMVLRQAGLPVEGIGLIIGVDRLLDMLRTGVNVCGDGVVSLIINKWNKEN